MSEKGVSVHTGLMPGRCVWGHPMKSRGKTDQQTKAPIMKDGVQVQQWAFGLAWPKEYFAANIWPHMSAEALTGYPNGVPPRFSWKYTDGDTIDSQGQSFALREGYAGCIVLTVSTELKCPDVFKRVGTGFVQVRPEEIKTGDYIGGELNFKVNVATGTNTPSLYVNPIALEFAGQGTEIISVGAVDPNASLGGTVMQLPQGAQPVGAAPTMQPGAGMPGATMAPPAAAPAMAPPAPPPPPVAGPIRPTDPTHIAPAPGGGELWWNGAAWVPGAAAAPPPPPAAALPPPAPSFTAGAMGVAPAAPMGMPGAAPAGGMPGMMPPR